ncbi:hypothetical protein ADL05_09155 [Nocardiopsis sp. NRRL B-16309]|nr:hypothetical protein ADL05_09155 [Nocardiopsis sp. NRRL B-16309]
MPHHEVDWPIRVGAIPEEAAHYQHRAIAGHLDEALNNFGTVVPRQVLSGTGGVGKTQLAAHHARTLRKATDPEHRIDLLIWASASSRDQITYAYTQAARHLFTAVPEDPEDAAQLFLTWLQDPAKHQERRWVIVWDDLTDPAQVRDLWPPHDQPHGRMLVTTRRRDHTLAVQGRHLLDVDVYTLDEARTFLAHALDAAGIAHTREELDTLAHDLGRLPLALGQAVPYMAELGLGCEDYLQVFHDRMSTLEEVFPDWTHPSPLAATWDLSLTQADTFHPRGVARPLMGLIALLDGNAIPEDILTTPPVMSYLAARRTHEPATSLPDAHALTPHQTRAALAALHRLNLINRTTPPADCSEPESGVVLVGAHQLVQRAAREHAATGPDRDSVHTLADSLAGIWPEDERDTALAQQLRSNTAALRAHHGVAGRCSEDWLWESGKHVLLFRAGISLGESGRVGEAVTYWENTANLAPRYLGPDHPETLGARHNLARCQGEAGDAAGAIRGYTELASDRLRVLGPDHPDTLATRHNLAFWRGEAGDTAGAIRGYAELASDHLRVLGPDHPDTLATRHNLARWQGELGDTSGAATTLEELLLDQIRVLGPDHPHTLTTRANLARWRGEAGDAAGAATTLEELLLDQIRVLGPDHLHTLTIRANLARWRGEAGDAAGAVTAYEQLLTDFLRVLGPDHPHTLTTRANLARWRGEAGDAAGAVTAYEQLLTDRLRVLGPDHPHTLTTRANLAWWTYESGDPTQAVELLTVLVRDQTQVLGPDQPGARTSEQVLQRWMEEQPEN